MMPYKITDSEYLVKVNTGCDKTWSCSVAGCTHQGYATTSKGAEFGAARHAASHTETELAGTGYVVRVNYAALAARRLA